MPIYRYFLDSPLKERTDVVLEEDEAHHLLHVTKLEVGDACEVVNGKNQLALARVKGIEKRRVTLHIESVTTKSAPSQTLILAQALVRQNRLDTILEKGTELGVTEF